jgi:hypothetical protein
MHLTFNLWYIFSLIIQPVVCCKCPVPAFQAAEAYTTAGSESSFLYFHVLRLIKEKIENRRERKEKF